MRKLNAPLYKYVLKLLYYSFAIYLPKSTSRPFGRLSSKIRYLICRRLFAFCGKDVNIEKGARFSGGYNVQIGDNSGIGINCEIPDGSIIGKNVMMGPNCYCLSKNHKFDRVDIPMCMQGYYESQPLIIEDDVWIGRDVFIMPGRRISKGSIIGARCVLTKDFPPFSIIGGNPGKLIKSRL